MSLDLSLRELLEAAAEAGARRALADAKVAGGSKLVPIKGAKVAYRAILEAEKAATLNVYRVGHSSFVDEDELDAWIKITGTASTTQVVEATDDVGELIEMNNSRRRGGRVANH